MTKQNLLSIIIVSNEKEVTKMVANNIYEVSELESLFYHLRVIEFKSEVKIINSQTIAVRGNAASEWENKNIQDLLDEIYQYREKNS